MKCSVLETDFAPIWKDLLPPGVVYLSKAMNDEQWVEDLVRLEADNDMLTLKTRHKTITIPAKVERRGVAFFPVHDVASCTNHMLEYFGITELRLDATPDCFKIAGWYHTPDKIRMAVFDDPATAPQTCEPELRPAPRIDFDYTPRPAQADQAKSSPKRKSAKTLAKETTNSQGMLFEVN